MNPMILALLSGGSKVLGSLFPSGRQKQAGRMQRSQMDLMSSFLTPGAFDAGGFGSNYFFGAPSDLQRSTRNAMAGPAPEQQTYDFMRPILEGMMTGTGPQFDSDIAAGNSRGGRFGSGNAMMRGEALRHLFNQRGQTAGTLGALSGAAGSANLARANYADQDSMRRMQLLSALFGFGGQMAFGGQESQNPFSALGQGGMDIATLIALMSGGGEGKKGWGFTMPPRGTDGHG